jgi:hypothetical protein
MITALSLPLWALLYVIFKRVSVSLNSFTGVSKRAESTVEKFTHNFVKGFLQIYTQILHRATPLPFSSIVHHDAEYLIRS